MGAGFNQSLGIRPRGGQALILAAQDGGSGFCLLIIRPIENAGLGTIPSPGDISLSLDIESGPMRLVFAEDVGDILYTIGSTDGALIAWIEDLSPLNAGYRL